MLEFQARFNTQYKKTLVDFMYSCWNNTSVKAQVIKYDYFL